ncbi:hypothetical protein [Neobacillus sp. DY30]|uniref:hypothetical protein n=1 Tax=Neobacillus sp. DY30 TaxID=3047871 RepID=UPI0024BFD687|nr:hypothetical protein [Neobacillus sp. DY30]WHY00208.1 hypothetical protein QNH29_27260 [Neobacillus sp. DY30]
MKRIIGMIKLFLKEPLWFKLLISLTFLISVIFSGMENTAFRSISKLAAAIFFTTYGIKFRYNRLVSMVFFTAALISIYLAFN